MKDQVLKDKAKKLEEDVESIITDEKADILNMLELIDDIQRLGLGYKFEDEIKRTLLRCVPWLRYDEGKEKSLHATALGFRLLRQHGYEVSQGTYFFIFELVMC